MKKKLAKVMIFVMAAMIVAAGLGVPAVQATDSQMSYLDEMYRLYNPNSGEHFYTKDFDEMYALRREYGWEYEGVGWSSPMKGTEGYEVYRLYNPNAGDHHYTMSEEERDALVKAGWKYEGVGWYSDPEESIKVYRQYNPNAKTGTHNYTTSKTENDALVAAGWIEEGIAWYGSYTEPDDLTGVWYENWIREDGSYLYAEIKDDEIIVKEYHDSGDVLVWRGTYELSDGATKAYTWTSKRIGDADTMMYKDETKDFRYDNRLFFDYATKDSAREAFLSRGKAPTKVIGKK